MYSLLFPEFSLILTIQNSNMQRKNLYAGKRQLKKKRWFLPMYRIRIRSDPVFLGYPDPDPVKTDPDPVKTDPDPDPLPTNRPLKFKFFLLYNIFQNTVPVKLFFLNL